MALPQQSQWYSVHSVPQTEGGHGLEQRPPSSALSLKHNSFESRLFNCRSLTPQRKKKKKAFSEFPKFSFRKLFLRVKKQKQNRTKKRITIEDLTELENSRWVTIIIITDSGKNHQWMEK